MNAFTCRYVGIIDFLQQWNFQKRAERNWKVTQLNGVVPKFGAHFRNQVYMRRVDPDGVSAMVRRVRVLMAKF
jgi:hypothetical protein